jgi:hypothetical protein
VVLWAVNIASTFLITHYLFEMNTRSLFFGWDGQSMTVLGSARCPAVWIHALPGWPSQAIPRQGTFLICRNVHSCFTAAG